MTVMLERWNDDKMDGLAAKVDGMDVRLTRVETKVDVLRTLMCEQRQEMNARFDGMQRMMFNAVIVMAGAFFTGVITLIVTRVW